MYAVVEFEIDNSISPVQKSWISADKKTCYYPPISQFKKIILKATMPDTNRWTLFNIVIKGEFDTLQSAITYSKYLSEVENTDNEQILKQKKIEKRKHPVKSLETNFDLSKKLKEQFGVLWSTWSNLELLEPLEYFGALGALWSTLERLEQLELLEALGALRRIVCPRLAKILFV
ncbi:hypothetical protein PVAND_005309 [Polypedilum vanderplanki]|uniref:Uncharacterized protein n=1 Tax=Polypedilum vanderplanki TaxID=319348 RepID=A0A9J6BZJ7_POLVA|nr:hypothetical protein PVAND_005309 [Polypedilum vanderplanki]